MGERHTGGSRQQHDSDLKTEDLKWRDKVWIIGTGGKVKESLLVKARGPKPSACQRTTGRRQVGGV